MLVPLLLLALTAAPAWNADPTEARGATLEGVTWRAEGPGWTARLTPLREAERWPWLRDLAGMAADPFAPRPGSPPAFVTFLLQIDNRSDGPLGFQAGNCRLITRNRKIAYPLDVPTLEATVRMMERQVPPAWGGVRRALFDGESTLRAGQRREGLLVFRAPDPRTRSFTVEVVLSTPGVEAAAFTAAYRRGKESGGR